MKLHQLNTLAAIAEAGSIRAAARALDVSPAALTKAVRELEADLKVPLVVRSTAGITFTEFGQALVVHARLVRTQLARAQAEIEALRGAARGRLSIGVTPWIALTFLPDTVRRFHARMPDIQLELFEGLLAVVTPRLRDGSLDFSIGKPPSGTHTEFHTQPLFSTASAVVARPGHPLAGSRALAALTDAEWLLNWDPGSADEIAAHMFTRRGVPVPRRIHLAHSLTIALGLLPRTDMLSVFPWPLVETALVKGALDALPLEESIEETQVVVPSRRDAPLTPVAECFLACLHEEIAEGARSRDPERRRLFHAIEFMA
jgi:DNA-binding transcriptional LysR family regulator